MQKLDFRKRTPATGRKRIRKRHHGPSTDRPARFATLFSTHGPVYPSRSPSFLSLWDKI